MEDIKISYVIVARDIDYISVDNDDMQGSQFAIIEPLIGLEVATIPFLIKTRVAFTTVGMTLGEEYDTFFYLFDPNGKEIIKKEKKFLCRDNDSNPIVTTFVHNSGFNIEAFGEYVFKVGLKNIVSSEYTLYISEGVI
ncbi:hypothetical protein MKY95_20890 [Paenibacillus sp. FSL P4-0176]|uniref:hypothetical protein n=1 Tax=Paenibacillus sp. FSL P4-0176 TaxID=2921631 RepID=UPI0030D1EF42